MRRRIEVNGHHLNVEDLGPSGAPAVILLHHGLGSAASWKHQIPALTEAGFRTIAYDRWGYGLSEPRPSLEMPCFVEDRADLAALLDVLGLKTSALVGHSDGGTIALYHAAQFPERVSRIAVAAAHIYLDERMPPGIEGIRRKFEDDERFRSGLARLHGDQYEDVFQGWYDGWLRPAEPERTLKWDMRSQLKEIRCPALVMQGLDDEHAGPEHAKALAQAIPGAQLWLAEGMAHMLPAEAPEAFNARLIAFLQS